MHEDKITDSYGDVTTITGDGQYGRVYLSPWSERHANYTDLSLTPAQAREMAEALTRAADDAEGVG